MVKVQERGTDEEGGKERKGRKKLTTVNPPRNRLQTLNVPRPGTSIVPIIILTPQLLRHGLGNIGDDAVGVELEDLRVDVQVRRVVEEGRVVEGREDRLGEEGARGEGVLVGAVRGEG